MNDNRSEIKTCFASLQNFIKPVLWFSLVISALLLVPTIYMFEVYERVINSKNHETLLMLTILVVGSIVLMELLDWARTELMRQASIAFDITLRQRVFSVMFQSNLKKMPGGTLQTMSDFRDVREFLHSPALMAVMDTPSSFIFLVCIFWINPILGSISIIAAFIQTAIGFLNERATNAPLRAANDSLNSAQMYADASLKNAEVIKAMGMIGNIHNRWFMKQADFLKLQAIASLNSGYYQAWSRFIQNVVASALLGLGAWLVLKNELNGGAGFMIVGSVLGARVLTPLVQAISQWQNFLNARNAYTRLSLLLRALPVRASEISLPRPMGSLQVDNVLAGAPGDNRIILRNINFSLNPGEVLAVVGPSASGKTTLARMLVGLWPALSGKVRLDGADVHAWNKEELGPHIGYLPQNIELFDGTIAENIARFGLLDFEKIQVAATAVGLHELIMTFPENYNTHVGKGATVLSGGQRQRIALARAIYDNPSFVVLDEPNSSLDHLGDQALVNAIAQLKNSGTTFVIITHRTNIFSVTDKILILRDGVVQGFGRRDDILNPGSNAQLA